MPVAHIGLTVSHLPSSCSFFLSALQPLGYRYIGQQGSQIGLGIHDADFFLCQETPGVKAGAAHIAFTAPSRAAVRDFYAAALTAGGRPNGSPASRSDDEGHFNAAILDLDGNSIEVVFRNGPDLRDDGTVIQHSRVITWRRTVSETYYDDRNVASSQISRSTSSKTVPPAAPTVVSKAPSVASKAPSIARSVSEPIAVSQVPPASNSGDGTAKTIIGTLLGAAAGAAVAYAMVSSERDSAKKEAEFNAFKTAQAAVTQLAQTNEQPKLPMQDPQPVYDAQPKQLLVHRNISDTESQYSSAQARSACGQRAIDAASYHSTGSERHPLTQVNVSRQIEYAPAQSVASSRAPKRSAVYVPAASVAPSRATEKAVEYVPAASVAPSRAVEKAVEYIPAASVAPSRAAELRVIEYVPSASVASPKSHFSTHRSVTNPELQTVDKARSTVSKAHSPAPSSFISTFIPDEIERKKSNGSIASHHSSKSKAKSSHSHASKHPKSSSSRRSSSKSRNRAHSPSKATSKVGSIVGSILGRGDSSSKSTISNPFRDEYEISDLDEYSDYETVAPSDSISNAGSSSRRSHRSSKHSSDGHSSHSARSKSSRHSSKSHRSSRSGRTSEYHTADERLSTVVSEPSDASTVKPGKGGEKSGRKDSVTGRYDGLFDKVQYGSGEVLPVRGITPSMVWGGAGGGKEEKPVLARGKSMLGYAMAQKLRAFEG